MSSLARRILTVATLAGALALPLAPRSAEAHGGVSVSVDFFFDDLAPYGRWFDVAPYGTVWMPAGMGPTWRPYTTGRWIYADCGWTWVADEPWGWAPFHYGRWAYEPAYGWLWVPGSVWAPAWVAWRWGGGYVGWAPLSPVMGYDIDYWGGPSTVVSFGWSFIGEREILAPSVRTVIVPSNRVPYLIERTRDMTRYERDGDRIVSRAIDPGAISRVIGRPVQVHRVVDAPGLGPARVHGDVVQVYRPAPATMPARRGRPFESGAPVAAPGWSTLPGRDRPAAPPGQVGRGAPERRTEARDQAPGQVMPRAPAQDLPRGTVSPAQPVYRRPQPATPAPAAQGSYGRSAPPVYRPAPVVTPRPAAPAARQAPVVAPRPAAPVPRPAAANRPERPERPERTDRNQHQR